MLITYLENGGPPRYGATALLQVMLDQTYVIGTQGYVNATSLTDAAVNHARNRRVIERAGVFGSVFNQEKPSLLVSSYKNKSSRLVGQCVTSISCTRNPRVHGPASRCRAWACSPDAQTCFARSVRSFRRSRLLPVGFR